MSITPERVRQIAIVVIASLLVLALWVAVTRGIDSFSAWRINRALQESQAREQKAEALSQQKEGEANALRKQIEQVVVERDVARVERDAARRERETAFAELQTAQRKTETARALYRAPRTTVRAPGSGLSDSELLADAKALGLATP